MSQLQLQRGLVQEASSASSTGRTLHLHRTVPRAAQAFVHSSSSSGRLPPVNTMGMGALARAIGHMAHHGSRPSNTWLQSYADATKHRLHHLRPGQLSTVIRSIVALEHHPGEEWLQDFDRTCFSHPGPFDCRSAVEVLASMTALPDINYKFPQHVYLKVLSSPDRFDSYQGLACLLHCLGSHNIPSQLWDESQFLNVIGSRMGQLLASLPDEEASRLVDLTQCKRDTLAAVLEVESDGCEAACW